MLLALSSNAAVANVANRNDAKETEKSLKLAHGYSSESTQPEPCNEYQHARFRWFLKIFASLCFDKSILRIGRVYRLAVLTYFFMTTG